jgi:bifunctional non-homologous end joining protein LigD
MAELIGYKGGVKTHPRVQEDLILHGVKITHPGRLVSEERRTTKGDVARYYAAVAPLLLREVRTRPITVVRCPSGIKADCFYQRNVGFGLGPHVHPFSWDYKGRSYKYIYVNDEQGIMEMIQMGVIEIHPWSATVDNIHTPDRMIFDLDPDENVPFAKVKDAALEIRTRLAQAGLESLLKATGGKGLHVVVPLAPVSPWEEVKDWARALAHQMVQDAPDTKAKRRGKILIDFFRNDYTATAIAGYSLRARPGAPVAVPLEWHELTALHSASQFDMEAVLTRLQRHPPEQDFPPQRLPQAKTERMHGTRTRDSADGSAPRRSAA